MSSGTAAKSKLVLQCLFFFFVLMKCPFPCVLPSLPSKRPYMTTSPTASTDKLPSGASTAAVGTGPGRSEPPAASGSSIPRTRAVT